jgi:hypothetical protein
VTVGAASFKSFYDFFYFYFIFCFFGSLTLKKRSNSGLPVVCLNIPCLTNRLNIWGQLVQVRHVD